jgi:translation initiation factor eIF-2B subunit delta
MQPNMANLKKNIAEVIYCVKKAIKTRKKDAEVLKCTLQKIQFLLERAEQNKDRIALTGSKLIPPNTRIVTIGHSALVAEILITAFKQRRKFETYCLESAPTREGRILAEKLARQGLSVSLAGDVCMGSLLQQATLILCGSVRLYENGFVNKIGTLPLALAAGAMKMPFYLVAETDKICSEREYAIRFYMREPEEVYIPRHKKIKIYNFHYESIPLSLVTKIITEDGVFDLFEFKNWYLKD